jgi:hypothetical protein
VLPSFLVLFADVFYRQALIWAGAPFCPALPFLALLVCVLLIEAKKRQVLSLTRPPKKPMGVAHQYRNFRSYLVVTLIIAVRLATQRFDGLIDRVVYVRTDLLCLTVFWVCD